MHQRTCYIWNRNNSHTIIVIENRWYEEWNFETKSVDEARTFRGQRLSWLINRFPLVTLKKLMPCLTIVCIYRNNYRRGFRNHSRPCQNAGMQHRYNCIRPMYQLSITTCKYAHNSYIRLLNLYKRTLSKARNNPPFQVFLQFFL